MWRFSVDPGKAAAAREALPTSAIVSVRRFSVYLGKATSAAARAALLTSTIVSVRRFSVYLGKATSAAARAALPRHTA